METTLGVFEFAQYNFSHIDFPVNQMHRDYDILKIQDNIQYKQSKIIHYLRTGGTKLPKVLNKLIISIENFDHHNTRRQDLVYDVKPRKPIENRLLECNASKQWNNLHKQIILQKTHGEFMSEFYNFKLRSYKDSAFNFASNVY